MKFDTSLTNLLSVMLLREFVKDVPSLNQATSGGGEPAAVHVKNTVVLTVAMLLLGNCRISAGATQRNKTYML